MIKLIKIHTFVNLFLSFICSIIILIITSSCGFFPGFPALKRLSVHGNKLVANGKPVSLSWDKGKFWGAISGIREKMETELGCMVFSSCMGAEHVKELEFSTDRPGTICETDFNKGHEKTGSHNNKSCE